MYIFLNLCRSELSNYKFVYKAKNSLLNASQSWFRTTECLFHYASNLCKGSASMDFFYAMIET